MRGVRFRSCVGTAIRTLLTAITLPAVAAAQAGGTVAPARALTMPEAVRLALEFNQTLQSTRLGVNASKADEITAALKPNVNVSFGASGFSIFSPGDFTFGTATSQVTYDAGLGYTFERGAKRAKRIAVAEDTTETTRHGVEDAERQLRFQTEQAFISVLLAKSTLDVARQDLKDFTDVVTINRQRVASGDLAEGDFLPIEIQQLQFETDVSAAEVALVQARAALRQLVGYDAVTEDFDVTGDLRFSEQAVALDDLEREALASRPDLLAARSGVTLARDAAALERANRARDIAGNVGYEQGAGTSTVGVGASFDLPFHDRNQGNIAKADVAVQQATATEAATRVLVLTDVTSAFAALQTSARVVKLYEAGYLDQARRSLEITTYAFQRGSSSLPSLLDAERTYRDTQLAYRQALAAFMTNVRQINFVVGKQVMP